jgi:eukaryotic-like serine/threonine-protein kinase
MKRCQVCGSFFKDLEHCARDGSPLVDTDEMVDRYRIVDRIGDGGMGAVYRAIHTLLDDRIVAIKLLHRDLAKNPEVVERFFREARAASRVESPHIVQVIDFRTATDGDSFLVMEYLEGTSLRQLLRDGPLQIPHALSIATQIAEGLEAAHEKGIVHRDLKPENVVLLPDDKGGFVKLLDFGIAKLTELRDTQLTRAGIVMGTPDYMSPEQASGEAVDGRTDIYALGSVLYEMLTGQVPFVGDNVKEVLVSHITKKPDSPREVRPEISDAVEAVVMHALEKKRESRPASMRAFAAEIQHALETDASLVSELDSELFGGAEAGGAPGPPGARPIRIIEGKSRRPDVTGPFRPMRFETPGKMRAIAGPLAWIRRIGPILGVAAGVTLGVVLTLLITGKGGKTVDDRAGKTPVATPARSTPDGAVAVAPRAPDARVPSKGRKGEGGRGKKGGKRLHVEGGGGDPGRQKPLPEVAEKHEVVGKWAAQVIANPLGVKVFDGDRLLGLAPLKVDTSEPRVLTLYRANYEIDTVWISRHSTETYRATLKRSATDWSALSLRQLKAMADQGQISQVAYRFRRREISSKREEKIRELKIEFKLGHITKDQYQRLVKDVMDSFLE